MKHYFCVLILLFSQVAIGKQVAITFDDSPRAATGYLTGPERASLLINNLKQHNVEQVAFFSVSSRLDEEGIERLNQYANAGHVIANHTHTHPDINKLTLTEYSEEIKIADKHLNQFTNFKKMFRFPYLREGNTQHKRDGIRNLLKTSGYFNAYITLNNYDWYIETLFQKAIREHGQVNLEKMKAFYVKTIIAGMDYYDQLAIKHLKRSPKHVLLLHEMDITALFIGDLVAELRKQGWEIITPEDAYTDEIANYQTAPVYSYNPGRIGEIAKDMGQKKQLWHHTLDEKYLDKQFTLDVIESK